MNSSTDPKRNPAALRRWMNLIVPGAGLILIGRLLAGFATGLAFAIALNAALATQLLMPDDFPNAARWSGLAAVTVYIVAQFLLIRAEASSGASSARDERRAALAALLSALREGRTDRHAVDQLRPFAETDLHVAYRLAQSATLNGDRRAARDAWERVQRIDPHSIYRVETAGALRRLSDESPSNG